MNTEVADTLEQPDTNDNESTMDNQTKKSCFKKACWKQPKTYIKIAIVVVFVVLIIMLIVFFDEFKKVFNAFLNWFKDNIALGSFVFILVYFLATVLLIPGLLLTLGAGFVYSSAIGSPGGAFLATLIVFIGAVLGATAAFLLGRYAFRDLIEKKKVNYPKFILVEKVITINGLKVTLILRLSPIMPFNFFNYAMGLTPVKFKHYMIAHIGMIPGTLAYCLVGGSLQSISSSTTVGLFDANNLPSFIITVTLMVLSIVGMVIVIIYGGRQFKKMQAQIKKDEEEDKEQNQIDSQGLKTEGKEEQPEQAL